MSDAAVPSFLSLPPGRPYGQVVDVWQVDLRALATERLDPTVLDDDERRRSAAYSRMSDRLRYVAAHVVIRQILGAYLNVSPREVEYVRGPCPGCGAPHGRPELRRHDQPLHFSMSRRAPYVLLAVAAVPVGVDLVVLAPAQLVADVSPLLHRDERAEIEAAPPTEQPTTFSMVWTRKEAYLKGIGIGIAADPSSCYTGTTRRTSPHGWSIVTIEVASGYVGAVAARSPDCVTIRRMSDNQADTCAGAAGPPWSWWSGPVAFAESAAVT